MPEYKNPILKNPKFGWQTYQFGNKPIQALKNEICENGECTAPIVLTASLFGFTTRSGDGPEILCDDIPIINFGFLGSAPNDTWANIIADANDKLSWIGTWELGENEIILNMDCNFYTFVQTLCPGEITLFATAA